MPKITDDMLQKYPILDRFLSLEAPVRLSSEQKETLRTEYAIYSRRKELICRANPVAIAAFYGKRKHVESLLTQFDVAEFGVQALQYAAEGGHLDIVEDLLTHPCVKEAAAADNDQALYNAAINGHLDIVKRLLQIKNVREAINTRYFENILWKSAERGQIEVVNYLLENYPILIDEHFCEPNIAISLFRNIIKTGQIDIIKILFAKLPHTHFYSREYLYDAIKSGSLAVFLEVLVLFDSNIQPLHTCELLMASILEIAAENNCFDILLYLLNENPTKKNARAGIKYWDNRILESAASKGHTRIVKLLLSVPKVSEVILTEKISFFSRYRNAFYEAALNGRYDIIKIFLEYQSVRDKLTEVHYFWASIHPALLDATRNNHEKVVLEILKNPAVLKKISKNSKVTYHSLLQIAANEGNLTITNLLLKMWYVWWRVSIYNNLALREAAEGGNLEVVDRLLSFWRVSWNANAWNNDALNKAAAGGHIEVVKRLLKNRFVKNSFLKSPDALEYAARNGHTEVVKYLLDTARSSKVKVNWGSTLTIAVKRGHIEAVKLLFDYAGEEEAVTKVCSKCHTYSTHSVFEECTAQGHTKTATFLLNYAKVQENAANNNNQALRDAASSGHLDIVNRLLEIPDVRKKAAVKNNEALRHAVDAGHWEIVKELLTLNEVQQNISAVNLRVAVESGHLDVVNTLLEYEEIFSRIADNDNSLLKLAAVNHHWKIVDKILTCPHVQENLSAGDNVVLVAAVRDNRLELVKILLQDQAVRLNISKLWRTTNKLKNLNSETLNYLLNIPEVLAYCENNLDACDHKAIFFIDKKIEDLHNRQLEHNSEALGVFDIQDPEEARLCFYILRFLIRHRNAENIARLRFLLSLPSVKAIAHMAITPGRPNELLLLAQDMQNSLAIEELLAIPAVAENAILREPTIHRNRETTLGRIATNSESAMVAPRKEDLERKASLVQYYGEESEQMFTECVKDLKLMYEQKKAIVRTGDGRDIELPLAWDDFQKERTNWCAETQEAALKAYYQHPVHTALRYLSRPNPWISERARYTQGDRRNRTAYVDLTEVTPLIGLLWVAAKDAQNPPEASQGSVEDRINFFIMTLAGMGRGHNPDGARYNPQTYRVEEFDDFTDGDKPTCNLGLYAPLYQGLVFHPLATVVSSQDLLKDAAYDLIYKHLQSKIKSNNLPEGFYAAWEKLEGTGEVDVILKELDISQDQQAKFAYELQTKHAGKFARSEFDCTAEVKKLFGLQNGEAHVVKFYTAARLSQLLQPLIDAENKKQEKEKVRAARLQALDTGVSSSHSYTACVG